MVFAGLVLVSCGDVADAPAPDLGQSSGDAALAASSDDIFVERAGSLPPGYNQRQCQWDACGGPLPDRQERTPEDR